MKPSLPREQRRILQRVEFHFTPKHGSWLNMAEIEIAILERNALSRRLSDEAALRRQVVAVETERNEHRRGIAWQFTSQDARRKLERLYPVIDPSSDCQSITSGEVEEVRSPKSRASSPLGNR